MKYKLPVACVVVTAEIERIIWKTVSTGKQFFE
jgi:hypothetical protein